MFKKKGFPEKDDLVVCTVKKTTPSCAFVILDEYENKEGMVHVSEMTRKWVRAMKTYLKPGTKLICKVLDVDVEKNFVNLSARRVSETQRRNKMKEWENEKKANDILEFFAKQFKIKISELYKKVVYPLLNKYGAVYPVFIEVARKGPSPFIQAKIDKKLAQELADIIKKRIVIPKAIIEGFIEMRSLAGNGLEIIKKIAHSANEIANRSNVKFELQYLGAPNYKFRLIADDYKTAENVLDKIVEQAEKTISKHKGYFKIRRE